MPSSENAERRTIDIAYSECAMHCGVAGRMLEVVEEDIFCNGKTIPVNERRGCYVISNGAEFHSVPMLKSEAGWR